MPDDKNKKALDKTQAGVAKTLADCGLTTDSSSRMISAALIADNLANGAKGVDAITKTARGIPASVGQCVADQYDDKKPSLAERVTSYFNGVVTAAKEMSSDMKADAKLVGEKMVMGSVSTVTNETPQTLKARPEVIRKASGPDAGL